MNFEHTSVLLKETTEALVKDAGGTYVDCTLGGAGHAAEITQKLAPDAWFIGIDQDPAAISAGKERLKEAKCRVDIVHRNFRYIDDVLKDLGAAPVDGIVFDLGVSSHQLDVAERGFSYMHNGPLDMRMNPHDKFSAADIINSYSEQQLSGIIFTYGEERWAKRIAKAIVAARSTTPLTTTGQLVDIIKGAIPAAARREGPHPAKRTFQAVRIAVNDELGILRESFEAAIENLKPGGRICIITFHSLEDRIAKQTLQNMAKGCICPKDFPVCVCNNKPRVKIVGKPVSPSPTELADNPRARSAKLRVAEKV